MLYDRQWMPVLRSSAMVAPQCSARFASFAKRGRRLSAQWDHPAAGRDLHIGPRLVLPTFESFLAVARAPHARSGLEANCGTLIVPMLPSLASMPCRIGGGQRMNNPTTHADWEALIKLAGKCADCPLFYQACRAYLFRLETRINAIAGRTEGS